MYSAGIYSVIIEAIDIYCTYLHLFSDNVMVYDTIIMDTLI